MSEQLTPQEIASQTEVLLARQALETAAALALRSNGVEIALEDNRSKYEIAMALGVPVVELCCEAEAIATPESVAD